MANAENKNLNPTQVFESYNPGQRSDETDDTSDARRSGDPAVVYEQPTISFPSLELKGLLHEDAPHTEQLVDEAAAGVRDLGLPTDASPAIVAHATLDPTTINNAIVHDVIASYEQGGSIEPRAMSELEAAQLEMQKKYYIKKIPQAIGGAAVTWAALKFGLPADQLSDTTRNNIAWVMAAGGAYVGYALSLPFASSPRRYRKAAQKEMKNLQKQEQRRRAITENHSR